MNRQGPFTSQLSTKGFALCEPAGIVPVRQVMGSCVLYVGRTSVRANEKLERRRGGAVRGVELPGITDGFEQARTRALGRLREEAIACGAHAVVNTRIRRGRWDLQQQNIEYLLTGTAVRLADSPAPSEPVMTALEVDDYWKLAQAGYAPVGIAAASVVYETAPSPRATRMLAGMRYSEGRATREIPEFSATVSCAIAIALARAGEGARKLGAEDVVGVRMERRLEVIERENVGRMPLGHEPAKRRDLRVTIHLLGTAVRHGEHRRERTERGTWREVQKRRPAEGTPIETVVELNLKDGRADEPEISRVEIEKGPYIPST